MSYDPQALDDLCDAAESIGVSRCPVSFLAERGTISKSDHEAHRNRACGVVNRDAAAAVIARLQEACYEAASKKPIHRTYDEAWWTKQPVN